MKFYALKPEGADLDIVLAIAEDACKGEFVPKLSRAFLGQVAGKVRTVKSMGEVYRTKYPDQESLDTSKTGTTLPLKVHHSSHISADRKAFLAASVGGPAHFMCPCTGFAGACLMYAEMNGLEAINVTAITDSHSIVREALQAFAPVVGQDLSQIHKMENYKQVLKEANQKSNSIFS